MKNQILKLAFALFVVLVLAACGGGSSSTSTSADTGISTGISTGGNTSTDLLTNTIQQQNVQSVVSATSSYVGVSVTANNAKVVLTNSAKVELSGQSAKGLVATSHRTTERTTQTGTATLENIITLQNQGVISMSGDESIAMNAVHTVTISDATPTAVGGLSVAGLTAGSSIMPALGAIQLSTTDFNATTTISGRYSSGRYMSPFGIVNTLNSGVISLDGTGSTGMLLNTGSATAWVKNEGVLNLNATRSVGINVNSQSHLLDGTYEYGNFDLSGFIENHGIIASNASHSIGIKAYARAGYMDIYNAGSITLSGPQSYAVFADAASYDNSDNTTGAGSVAFENRGVIEIEDMSSKAVFLGGLIADVTNFGKIERKVSSAASNTDPLVRITASQALVFENSGILDAGDSSNLAFCACNSSAPVFVARLGGYIKGVVDLSGWLYDSDIYTAESSSPTLHVMLYQRSDTDNMVLKLPSETRLKKWFFLQEALQYADTTPYATQTYKHFDLDNANYHINAADSLWLNAGQWRVTGGATSSLEVALLGTGTLVLGSEDTLKARIVSATAYNQIDFALTALNNSKIHTGERFSYGVWPYGEGTATLMNFKLDADVAAGRTANVVLSDGSITGTNSGTSFNVQDDSILLDVRLSLSTDQKSINAEVVTATNISPQQRNSELVRVLTSSDNLYDIRAKIAQSPDSHSFEQLSSGLMNHSFAVNEVFEHLSNDVLVSSLLLGAGPDSDNQYFAKDGALFSQQRSSQAQSSGRMNYSFNAKGFHLPGFVFSIDQFNGKFTPNSNVTDGFKGAGFQVAGLLGGSKESYFVGLVGSRNYEVNQSRFVPLLNDSALSNYDVSHHYVEVLGGHLRTYSDTTFDLQAKIGVHQIKTDAYREFGSKASLDVAQHDSLYTTLGTKLKAQSSFNGIETYVAYALKYTAAMDGSQSKVKFVAGGDSFAFSQSDADGLESTLSFGVGGSLSEVGYAVDVNYSSLNGVGLSFNVGETF